MKRISLTQGKYALVDDSDYLPLTKWKWHAAHVGRGLVYAARGGGKARTILMHRHILLPPKGLVCDHINGDTLDNRRSNLRVCTDAENRRSFRRKARGKLSRYIGVSYRRDVKKWVAYIGANSKLRMLGGYHDTEEAAALCRDGEAMRLGRSKETLNFPDRATLVDGGNP